MRKSLLGPLIFALLFPLSARGNTEVDGLLFRLRDETPFGRFRIIEQIGSLGTPEAIDALVSLFSDEDLRWMAVRQLTMFRMGAVPRLLEALESEDRDTVRFAIYALGSIKAEAAVEPIIRFLDDPSPEIRQNAVFALGMIRAEAATEHLIRALKDEDPLVRGYAASAHGEIGDPRAREALTEALRREDSSVINMANSLMALGSDQVVEILIQKLRDPDPNNRLYAVYALGRVSDPREIQPLIDILGSDEVGWLAAQALVNIGEPAVEPLLEALFSENEDVRLYATYALGQIGDRRASRALLKMFKDEHPLVRQTAAEAIISFGDTSLIPAITRELSSGNPQVRRQALEVLGRLGDESLVETISSYLSDPEILVVKTAIIALGNLGSERACPALSRLLGNRDSDVQDALRSAFLNIGEPAAPCLAEILKQKGTAAEASAIVILGRLKAPAAVSDILPYLRHPEPTFRRLAVAALTEIGDPRAEEYFLGLLEDADPALRMYASIGLMNMGGKIAIKLLLTSLGNPDTHWLAVRILDQISEREVDLLIDALKDERTRWYARQKLVELDGAILPQLEEGLRSEDPATRESIAIVLGEVKDRRAVRPLLEALRDEERFVMTSAASLVQIGDPGSVEPLIEMLSSRNEQVRLYAAYALGGLNDARAVEPLIGLLQDPDTSIRGVAAHALGVLGSREATRPLLDLLQDPSEHVRLTAVHALGKLHDRRAIPLLREQLVNDPSGSVRKAAKGVLDSFVYGDSR